MSDCAWVHKPKQRLSPALADLFHNRPAADFEHSFPWPTDDTVLVDAQPPAVAVVIVRNGTGYGLASHEWIDAFFELAGRLDS